jgi:hypothetical protein
VYRFEPALLETLWSKPIADDVLSTQLHRLPEWCVYFDLEGKSIGDIPIQVAYVHLEHQEDGYEELRVVLNCLEPKGAWARLNAVIIPLQEFVHQSLTLGPKLAQAVAPIVSCALYGRAWSRNRCSGQSPGHRLSGLHARPGSPSLPRAARPHAFDIFRRAFATSAPPS